MIAERCEMFHDLDDKSTIALNLHGKSCDYGRYDKHKDNIEPDDILQACKSLELLNEN